MISPREASALVAHEVERTYRRLVENLDYIMVGVADIERYGAVAMVPQWMGNLDPGVLHPFVRRLDLRDRRDDEAKVVERLRGRITRFTAMEREAVASRTHVDVVGIGLPGDSHPERARVEFFRAFDVSHANRKMSQSPMRYHRFLWGSPIAPASPAAFVYTLPRPRRDRTADLRGHSCRIPRYSRRPRYRQSTSSR